MDEEAVRLKVYGEAKAEDWLEITRRPLGKNEKCSHGIGENIYSVFNGLDLETIIWLYIEGRHSIKIVGDSNCCVPTILKITLIGFILLVV